MRPLSGKLAPPTVMVPLPPPPPDNGLPLSLLLLSPQAVRASEATRPTTAPLRMRFMIDLPSCSVRGQRMGRSGRLGLAEQAARDDQAPQQREQELDDERQQHDQ